MAAKAEHRRGQIDWVASGPFIAMHFAPLLLFWCGVSWMALAAFAASYSIRMFAITAGYHRYFSHRSFKTGRIVQFLLAFLGSASVQKGVLWWAANHRAHHRYSDTDHDIHSPVTGSFWWAHAGWFLCHDHDETQDALIPDLLVYPELRWLNRWHVVPAVMLAGGMALFGGLQLLVWGFFLSTLALYHATFAVNSFAHLYGTRRFQTRDDSRNNLLIALVAFGEGWHNNHHYSPSLEKQGREWWEIDVSHYGLTVLSWCGFVWDLRTASDKPSGPGRRLRETAGKDRI